MMLNNNRLLITTRCLAIAIGAMCSIGADNAVAEGMSMSTIGEVHSLLIQGIHMDAIAAHGAAKEARQYFLKKYLSTLLKKYDEKVGEFFYVLKDDILLSQEQVKRYLEDLADKGRTNDIHGEMTTIGTINKLLIRKIRMEAIIAYGDTEEARNYFLEKYLTTLPQEYDDDSGEFYYFVEGDILLSREQVERYLEDLAGGGRANDRP